MSNRRTNATGVMTTKGKEEVEEKGIVVVIRS